MELKKTDVKILVMTLDSAIEQLAKEHREFDKCLNHIADYLILREKIRTQLAALEKMDKEAV